MIYQLRVLIRGVSPMIWRCILVRCDSTLAELHSVLQAVFDWSGECLHCFCIHGKEYGSTADADRRIARLSDFRLHCGERFVYRYNFCSGWECEVRLQATIPAESKYRFSPYRNPYSHPNGIAILFNGIRSITRPSTKWTSSSMLSSVCSRRAICRLWVTERSSGRRWKGSKNIPFSSLIASNADR